MENHDFQQLLAWLTSFVKGSYLFIFLMCFPYTHSHLELTWINCLNSLSLFLMSEDWKHSVSCLDMCFSCRSLFHLLFGGFINHNLKYLVLASKPPMGYASVLFSIFYKLLISFQIWAWRSILLLEVGHHNSFCAFPLLLSSIFLSVGLSVLTVPAFPELVRTVIQLDQWLPPACPTLTNIQEEEF